MCIGYDRVDRSIHTEIAKWKKIPSQTRKEQHESVALFANAEVIRVGKNDKTTQKYIL